VHREASQGKVAFCAGVVLEAVHYFQCVDLGTLAADTDHPRVVLHGEAREPLVREAITYVRLLVRRCPSES
jgi:hypothetical protein